MNRWTLTATCAAAALLLAACGTSNMAGSAPPAVGQAVTASNATLQAYHWYLDKAEDANGRAQPLFKAREPKMQVHLNFLAGNRPGEQTVSSKVCNNMLTSYTLDGDRLETGRVISTMIGCQDTKLMQIERAVADKMERMQSVEVEQLTPQPRLVLTFSDGSRWYMSGQPTDATRFGSAGETVFLEVAPQTRPCASGESGSECLQVRELRFDDAGRKTAVGGWQDFQGSIEGFTFEPGLRTVLRLKRYAPKAPASGGAAVTYVMDMQVEAERIERP